MRSGEALSVLVSVFDQESGQELHEIVRYCDECQRWGASGTPHLCGENWSKRLGPVLEAALAGRKR